jgi:hypothetical protein
MYQVLDEGRANQQMVSLIIPVRKIRVYNWTLMIPIEEPEPS